MGGKIELLSNMDMLAAEELLGLIEASMPSVKDESERF